MGFNFFISAILLFVIGNFLFYQMNQSSYHRSLRALRKGLYTLFIVGMLVGIMANQIELSEWQFILTMTWVVVFIDISVLLTPSIMKFFNAEFKYSSYVEDNIEKNNIIQIGTTQRVQVMSEFIQNHQTYRENQQISFSEKDVMDQLKNFLNEYASKFGFSVQVWELSFKRYTTEAFSEEELRGISEDEIERYLEDISIKDGIAKVLEKIEVMNAFDLGDEFDTFVDSLSMSYINSIIEKNSFIVPIFLKKIDLLLVLKTEGGEIFEVDGVHITNLVHVFYWFEPPHVTID